MGVMTAADRRRNFSRTIALSSAVHTRRSANTRSERSHFQRAIVPKSVWSLSRAASAGSATIGSMTADASSTIRSMTASRSAAFEAK